MTSTRLVAAVAVVAAGLGAAALAPAADAQTTGTGSTAATTTTPTTTSGTSGGSVGAETVPCTVTSTSPGLGAGTYRGEITAASGGSCPDGSGNQLVTVQPGLGPITITNNLTYSNSAPLILNGNSVTINGDPTHRILTLSTSSLATINNVTFANGAVLNTGGAIRASGPLTLNGDTFTSNTGGDGGGAVSDNVGPVIVNNSTFQSNTAHNAGNAGDGGALRVNGVGATVTVTNSTFNGNVANEGGGGAIWVNEGNLTVTGSDFTNNAAEGDGGAILLNDSPGSVKVVGSTFSGNNHASNGGAISGAAVTVALTNSTVTGNVATQTGGGVAAATITLAYSDVVGNTAPVASNLQIVTEVTLETFASVITNPLGGGANCGYSVGPAATSSGYNFISDTSCLPGGGAPPAPTDLIVANGDPKLGGLANNGGPTPTLLPQPGSPLIDAIPVAACQTLPLGTGVTTDQRGFARPAGAGCDIGAVEVQGATAIVAVPSFTG